MRYVLLFLALCAAVGCYPPPCPPPAPHYVRCWQCEGRGVVCRHGHCWQCPTCGGRGYVRF